MSDRNALKDVSRFQLEQHRLCILLFVLIPFSLQLSEFSTIMDRNFARVRIFLVTLIRWNAVFWEVGRGYICVEGVSRWIFSNNDGRFISVVEQL